MFSIKKCLSAAIGFKLQIRLTRRGFRLDSAAVILALQHCLRDTHATADGLATSP